MIEFLLSALISGIIISTLIYGYFKNYKKEVLNKATNWLSVASFSYFPIFLFSILWFSGVLDFSDYDFTVVYSAVLFLQTLVLFKVVIVFNNRKKTYYLLLFYFAAFLAFVPSKAQIFNFALIISFLLNLIVGVDFLNLFIVRRRAAYVLIVYSLISLAFQFLFVIGIGEQYTFSIFSNAAFLTFCLLFLKDVDKYPKRAETGLFVKEESRMALFVKYFIYVTVIINLVLISTIGVHEFAHVAVSRYYECQSRAIIYEEGAYPYSEILCRDESGKLWITLAGPMLPIFIALLLLVLGGNLMRPFAFLIIGFNAIAAYKDFLDVGLSANLNIAASVFGGICLLIGIYALARETVRDHNELFAFHQG